MKRSALLLLLAACSSGDDVSDAGNDASIDQTAKDVAQDVAKDAAKDGGSDVVLDVSEDVVSQDVAADAPDDSPIDAPDETSVDAGTGCTSNSDCLSTEFCDKPLGDCAGSGKCTVKPKICSNLVKFVCGCDKMTHPNACYANRNGVSVDYNGVCE